MTEPTKVAYLQLQWRNPYQGQVFVDQVMKDFIATQLSWKTQSASATESFICTQLDKIRDSLSSADKNLTDYPSKTGILHLPATATAVITQLSHYEVQRITLLLQEEALQQLANDIAHAGTSGGNPYLISQGALNPYLVSQTGDLVLGQFASGLATAQVQLEAQRLQFSPAAPEIKIQEATIAKTQDAIRTLVGNDLALASSNLQNDDAQIALFETQLRAMPGQALQTVELTRSSDVFCQLFVLLMQKDEEAEVSKAATIIDTRVVTPAQLPFASSKPRAAGRHHRPSRSFPRPVLGMRPRTGEARNFRQIPDRRRNPPRHFPAGLWPYPQVVPQRGRWQHFLHPVAKFVRRGVSAAALRPLPVRLRAGFPRDAHHFRCRADGKTTVAANLAKLLADDGRRVVLIDGDLHLGRVHQILSLDHAPGLTEWLVTKQRPKLQVPPEQRFSVLTTGVFPPNPSDLMNEPMLATIFAKLRQ